MYILHHLYIAPRETRTVCLCRCTRAQSCTNLIKRRNTPPPTKKYVDNLVRLVYVAMAFICISLK